jgi:hypothetical protein
MWHAWLDVHYLSADAAPELRDWQRAWIIIAEMKGLRHLFMDMALGSESRWKWNEYVTNERKIFSPLKTLTAPLQSFRLRVPYPTRGSVEVGGQAWVIESACYDGELPQGWI